MVFSSLHVIITSTKQQKEFFNSKKPTCKFYQLKLFQRKCDRHYSENVLLEKVKESYGVLIYLVCHSVKVKEWVHVWNMLLREILP